MLALPLNLKKRDLDTRFLRQYNDFMNTGVGNVNCNYPVENFISNK